MRGLLGRVLFALLVAAQPACSSRGLDDLLEARALASARFQGANYPLTRTTNVPNTNFSISLWSKVAVTGAFGAFVGLSDANSISSGNFLELGHDAGASGSIKLYFSETTNTTNGPTNVATTDWRYEAGVVSGSTSGTFYWTANGGSGTLSSASLSITARTYNIIGVGEIDGDILNGNVQCLKIWDAALAQADIELEQFHCRPQRQANLNSFFPFLKGTASSGDGNIDYSGNARNLTAGSSATTQEVGPPIVWN